MLANCNRTQPFRGIGKVQVINVQDSLMRLLPGSFCPLLSQGNVLANHVHQRVDVDLVTRRQTSQGTLFLNQQNFSLMIFTSFSSRKVGINLEHNNPNWSVVKN